MRIAINGYGRIGRCILRALYESGRNEQINIVAINELSSLSSITHLTRFDSTHGKFCGDVECDGEKLLVNDDAISVFCERDFSALPWKKLGVDIVLECSGNYTERSIAEKHLLAGAGKVLFSCPAESDVDATIVYGMNEAVLTSDDIIVSNASCTTNCISHIIRLLDESFGIENGVITTIHSMMNDQPVIDAYHNPDLRKSRSSSNSIIPVTTGLAKGIDRLFPQLMGRFKAVSLRVPTMNVSLMELTALLQSDTDPQSVNKIFQQAAEEELAGIFGFTELPLVSCDFNHDTRSAIIDSSQTSMSGERLINCMAWFDNEWGYANRMLDTAVAMMLTGQ